MGEKFLVIVDEDAATVEANLIDMETAGSIRLVKVDDISLEDPLPEIVEEFLVFPLDKGNGFVLDFQKVFALMDHIVHRPLAVSKTLLRLHTALTNYYSRVYDLHVAAKEEFDEEEAKLRVRFADNNNDEIPDLKRTDKNIEALIKTNSTYQLKRVKLTQIEQMKSRVYSAKDAVKKAFDLCQDFIENGKNVHIESVPVSSFDDALSDIAIDTNKVDEL